MVMSLDYAPGLSNSTLNCGLTRFFGYYSCGTILPMLIGRMYRDCKNIFFKFISSHCINSFQGLHSKNLHSKYRHATAVVTKYNSELNQWGPCSFVTVFLEWLLQQ